MYLEVGSLIPIDNFVCFKFTEKPGIHVYLLLQSVLLLSNDILERFALHNPEEIEDTKDRFAVHY